MDKKELDNIRKEIRLMSIRSGLYKVLKEELLARGNWKNKARGKSFTSDDANRLNKLKGAKL